MCAANSHVRFTPNSDIDCVFQHVRFEPIADIGPTSDEHGNARQDDPDLGELARLRIHLD